MYQSEYPSTMGLFTQLTSDELKEMLNDDSKFDSVVKDMKKIKDSETEKEMLIASNRSLAEFNLSKEPEYIQLKEDILEKSEKAQQLNKKIQQLLEEYKSKSAGVSADTTLALLQTAAAESEEQSEALAQSFLAGNLELDKFLEEFQPVRKLMHLRKFKAEKMSELLREKSRRNVNNGLPKSQVPYPKSSFSHYPQPPSVPQGNPLLPYPTPPSVPYPSHSTPYPNQPSPYSNQPAPYPNQPAPYPNQSVPYPSGPVNMPMPGMFGNHF